MQQVSSPLGRTLPGMPLESEGSDDDESPRRRRQFDTPSRPWWLPGTTVGRVFIALGALIVLGSLFTGYLLLAHFLERDSRFRIAGIANIRATGLSQVSRSQVSQVFGEEIGKNIFFVRLGDRRKQLEQIPWVKSAIVMRRLPDQIRVAIVERTPIAFVRQGQEVGLVDADGVLLSMPAASISQHHYSFPVVTGIDPRDPQPSRHARMAVYQRLIGELDSTGQHLSEQISEIDLTDPEDARVLMPEQGSDILAHFGEEQFLSRYQRYKAHITEWRQQYPRLEAIDLRYDQQVVLQMAHGSGSSSAAVNADDGKPVTAGPAGAHAPTAAVTKPSPSIRPGTNPSPGAPSRPSAKLQQRGNSHSASKTALGSQARNRIDAKRAALRLPKPENRPAVVRLGQ